MTMQSAPEFAPDSTTLMMSPDGVRPTGVTVGVRLRTINGVLLLALLVVGFVAWQALNAQLSSATTVATLSRAQQLHQDATLMQDALRADVLGALLAAELPAYTAARARESLEQHSARLRSDLETIEALVLPDEARGPAADLRALADQYIATARRLIHLAVTDRPAALAAIPAFDQQYEALLTPLATATATKSTAIATAERRSQSTAALAKRWVVLTAALAIVVASGLVVMLGWSIRTGVVQIRDTATRLAAGDLAVRSRITSSDDFGEISRALNQMASRLQELFTRLRADAERDAYIKQLGDALEMADTEADVCAVVGRAMTVVAPTTPMELLVSDSSRAHLENAVGHPRAGAPGCGVESPFACVAIRRGQTTLFPDSQALNACAYLQGRAGGPLAAVCSPVSFMGRALGVVHAATPVSAPLSAAQVTQLNALGVQAGMRIGTVRAFDRSQVQANTDGLTGLCNRRALEAKVRQLRREGRAYAFVLADLDHFKKLNDTQGHEAGDRCLRLYAEVLRRCLRPEDVAARWGGEEFCLLIPGTTAVEAVDIAERVRHELAQAVTVAGTLRFTCSLGIADSRMATDFETVVRIADDALYRSKETGRDRTTVGDPVRVAASTPLRRDVDAEQTAVMRTDLLHR